LHILWFSSEEKVNEKIFTNSKKFFSKEFFYTNHSLSSRILIATVWICSLFLMAFFGANLVALFAHGASKLPFES